MSAEMERYWDTEKDSKLVFSDGKENGVRFDGSGNKLAALSRWVEEELRRAE